MLINFAVVILCGGQGTRLASVLPRGAPKCLAPVADRPFLAWLIDRLLASNIPKLNIILSVGYGSRPVREAFPDILAINDFIDQGGTVSAARHILWKPMAPFVDNIVFINGDTWLPFEIQELVDFHNRLNLDFSASRHYSLTMPERYLLSGAFCFRRPFAWASADPPIASLNFDEKFVYEYGLTVGIPSFFFHQKPFYDIGTPESLAEFESYMLSSNAE